MLKRVVRGVRGRLGFPHRRPGQRPVDGVFDDWATDGRAERMEDAHAPVVRRILQRMALPPDARVLDIGCGNGYAVRWLAPRLGEGQAVGLDASGEMIAVARRLSAEIPNAVFECSIFPRHSLPLASFDLILSIETMYYMRDVQGALGQVLDLLRPGGRFVSAVDFYLENPESHGWPGYVGAEMQLLSARAWRRAFKKAGFDSVTQERLRLPVEEAREPWHATVGTLVTQGLRP